MTAEPTERQREVLAAIASYHRKHKAAPSREDLVRMTGANRRNSVDEHIRFLAMKGLVMHTSGVPRSLHLTKKGREALKGGSNGSRD